MTGDPGRKLLRDLKQNSVQFPAVFVMCFFAMFMIKAFDPVAWMRH